MPIWKEKLTTSTKYSFSKHFRATNKVNFVIIPLHFVRNWFQWDDGCSCSPFLPFDIVWSESLLTARRSSGW